MTGERRRVWNEETQRWEDTGASGDAAPPPPPLPPLPGHLPYVPETPTVPTVPAPPVPAAGGGRALWWKVVAAAVVLGLGAGYGVLKLMGEDDGDGHDRAPTAATAPPSEDGVPMDGDTGAGAPSSESASPSPSESAGTLPAGYHQVEDPAGYALAVPDGWERSERDTGVFYATKGDRNLLQIFVITEGDLTPYEAVRQSSKNLGGQQPGYEEVSLDRGAAPEGASPAVGEDTARLVYAYDSEKLGTRKQGVEYAFTAADGKKYALVAAGPLDDWAMTRESAETALAHWATGASLD